MNRFRIPFHRFALLGLLLAGCNDPEKQEAPVNLVPANDASASARFLSDSAISKAEDAASAEPMMIGAIFMQTPIMNEMDWPIKEDDKKKTGKGSPTAQRIGYMRHGARLPVAAGPFVKDNCLDGWYELVGGGFVCGKYATTDMNHPRLRVAPHLPDVNEPLPYQYGFNLTNGTPLYRHVPSRSERAEYEGWLGKKAKPRRSIEEDELDGGTRAAQLTAEEDFDGGVPWYLRGWDGGKPQVTLDDLKGEGPMSRRMVRGFYLALDKDITAGGSKWWKTTGGLIAPYDRVYVQKLLTDFKGIWLTEAAATEDAADGGEVKSVKGAGFLMRKSFKYSIDGKKVTQVMEAPRRTGMRLTGETATVGGVVYAETTDGLWVRSNELLKVKPNPPPSDIGPNEKWIDVNLETQTLVAFEGDKMVYATLVSSGKKNTDDPEKDHATPTGTFRIREKHIAATMDGDVASDGPYSIEDVPWIMYFSGSYALHGAFWHADFGRMRSHGCVNLSPNDARELFGWTEPHLPTGWHAVWATADKPGTRVIVHDVKETKK